MGCHCEKKTILQLSDSRCISFCSLNSLAKCAWTLETLNFIESETHESFDMLAVHMLQLVCLKKHWTCLMGKSEVKGKVSHCIWVWPKLDSRGYAGVSLCFHMPRCHFGVSIFSVTY